LQFEFKDVKYTLKYTAFIN